MYRILYVNSGVPCCENFAEVMAGFGFVCKAVETDSKALRSIVQNKTSLVLFGIGRANIDAVQLIDFIKKEASHVPVVAVSDSHDIDFVVKILQCGAVDFIQAPSNGEEIAQLAHRLGKLLPDVNDGDVDKTPPKLPNVIGNSEYSQKVAAVVFKVAAKNVNVMISGETGTGKELIAKSIHSLGDKADKPFIPIDCGALPANLIESELFGHEQGAFTGASKIKMGLLELAHGGTVFLDEITEMDVYLQAKLLRVLQERHFRRVGGSKLIHVDVRIISATNMDPLQAVNEQKLRKDLYYRLDVVSIKLPPLRARKKDIPVLVDHFIKQSNHSSRVEVKGISRRAKDALMNYSWPGNIRELQNAIQQAVSLVEGDVIDLDDLPDWAAMHLKSPPKSKSNFDMSFQEARKHFMREFCAGYFKDYLEKHKGNMSKVARDAGLSRGTLYKLFKEFNIQNPYPGS